MKLGLIDGMVTERGAQFQPYWTELISDKPEIFLCFPFYLNRYMYLFSFGAKYCQKQILKQSLWLDDLVWNIVNVRITDAPI